MKDMSFQIEKMKTLRANSVGSIGKPAQVIIGMCDVMLEILAEMQMNAVRELAKKMDAGPEPNSKQENIDNLVKDLRFCANELENPALFPARVFLGSHPVSEIIRQIVDKIENRI